MAAVTDVVLSGGEGMLELVGRNLAGLDAYLDLGSLVVFGGRGPQFGPHDAGGEATEVLCELGLVVEFELLLMGG